MNLYSIPPLIISLVLLILGFFVFVRNIKSNLNKIFFLLCLTSSIWLFSYSIAYTCIDKNLAFLWLKIGYCGIPFIAITVFHYTVEFLGFKKVKPVISAVYFIGLVCILFIWKYNFIIKDVQRYYWGYYPLAGKFHHFFLIFFISLISISCTLLLFVFWFGRKDPTSLKRTQIKYFFLAIFTYNLASVDFLPNYGIEIYPFGFFPAFVFISIIGYSIIRYRLMDIRVFITRAVAFFISYPFLLAIPFILAYRLYPYLYPRMGRHWWLVPSGMLAVIATLAPVAYAQLRRKMEGRLLAEQKRYQKLLLQAASGMVTEHDLGKLSKLIVYIVKRSVKIKFASIFLDDKKEGVYRLIALRDSGEAAYKNVTFLYEHPFVKYVKRNKEPFFYEEMPKYIRSSLSAFSDVNLVIPATIEDNLLGFVFLGEKNNREPYTEDDINVFKILSSQASLAIENCIFLQEFKNAQERIFTAEKLASIGGMADGVAHQIKNRLNQFSVASGELKYEIKDFLKKYSKLVEDDPDIKKSLDYMSEIADSLIKNVKKTDGIIKGILNFARVEEKETFFSRFPLKEVVDLATDLLKVKHEVVEVPIKVNLDPKDLIYGVKSQITETIYNILDNAFEAMQEKKVALASEEIKDYTPAMELKLSEHPTTHLIEIIDNGAGINKRDVHKIFAPFFTTKSSYKSGTGIGMYVVKRMVEENHKGKVWFESEHGVGTHFFIQLPRR